MPIFKISFTCVQQNLISLENFLTEPKTLLHSVVQLVNIEKLLAFLKN